jgi:plastocyanin
VGWRRRCRLLVAAGVVWATLLGTPGVASETSVDIGGFKFSPGTVTAQQGDTVTWHWVGPDVNHTVTSTANQADSFESHPAVPVSQVTGPPPGGTYSHVFNTPGSFTYFCRVHPFIKGTVVVKPAPPLPPPPPPTGVTQQAAPAAPHPTFKECISQRNFIIRLRETGGVHLKSATVRVNGNATPVERKTIEGRSRLTARVDLRGLPKGQYVVAITAKTTEGRPLHGTRLYKTCDQKNVSYVLPKL